MGFLNTIAVISSNKELIEQITTKLVLLRDLDKVVSNSYEGALDFLSNQSPNVVIIHCMKDNPDALKLISDIKNQSMFSNVSILLLDDFCSRETIIDAFDLGISDVLKCPVLDYELLIRVIWCIQKNELNTRAQTHVKFLKSLGVMQAETGVYTQKYCDEFLKSELEQVNASKTNACLMLVTPDSKYPGYKNPKEFIDVINKSIRINDSVAIKDIDEFYIFLPKTKLNGVYPVFERINNNLGVDCGANASVMEIKDEKYEVVKEQLQDALNKAKEDTNALIVASGAYSNNPNAGINLAKQQPVQSPAGSEKKVLPPDGMEKKSKLYIQAYRQKCKIVFEPVFEKYQNYINAKLKDVIVKYEASVQKTKFSVLKNNVCANLSIVYSGEYKVRIDTSIVSYDITKSTNSLTVDFVQLNFQKLSQILEELYVEFNKYIKTSN